MKIVRWGAVAATALMSLMNLPFLVDDGDVDLARPVAALISLLGVLGLVAAVALARRSPWGAPAAAAIGVVNLALALLAITQDWSGAAIGLVVAVLAFVLSATELAHERTPGGLVRAR